MANGKRRLAMAARVMQALVRAPSPRFRLPQPMIESLFNARRFAARMQLRRVTVEGFDIPYLEGGHGDPILLIHGFGDSKDAFVDVARSLTTSHRVVMPDLPGFGDASAPSDFFYSLDNITRIVLAFCDAVGLERMHVGGNSLGGAVSLNLALMRPGMVRSLMLLNAAGVVMPEPSPLKLQLDAGINPWCLSSFEEYEEFMRFVLERAPPVPWPVRFHLAERFIARADIHRKIMDDLLHGDPDLTPRLREIEVPTLALWGDRDRLIDISAGRVFHRHIAGSRFVILHGIGHCPQYEAPMHTASLLGRFVRNEASRARSSARRSEPRFDDAARGQSSP